MSITRFELQPTRSARARWTLPELDVPLESIAGLEIIGSAPLKAVSPLLCARPRHAGRRVQLSRSRAEGS
jgi:hypothetical protein